jgi:hypothetical protein
MERKVGYMDGSGDGLSKTPFQNFPGGSEENYERECK